MSTPIIGRVVDERFLNHRLRSTSLAGILSVLAAAGLFAYRFYVLHQWRWDLFAIMLTFVVVKFSVLAWYRVTD